MQRAVDAIKQMGKIDPAKITVSTGGIGVTKGGVITTAISVAEEKVLYDKRPVPDLLAYLQNETELTRSTLVRILKESGRLADFFVDPQRFMDAVATILKHELHRLLLQCAIWCNPRHSVYTIIRARFDSQCRYPFPGRGLPLPRLIAGIKLEP